MPVAPAGGFRNEADFLASCIRWTRLLFERMRAGAADGGEVSAAATRLGGAAPVERNLSALIDRLRADIERRAGEPMANGRECPLVRLQRSFSLDPIAVEMVLALVAYELDPSLQAAYAEVARAPHGTRLCVGYLARLIRPEWSDVLAAGRRLDEDDPLRYFRLVLIGQSDQGPGLAGRSLEAHRRAVDVLAGCEGLDPALRITAHLYTGTGATVPLPYPDHVLGELTQAWRWCRVSEPMTDPVPSQASRAPGRRAIITGPDPGAKEALFCALVPEVERAVLAVRVARLLVLEGEPELALAEHLREGMLHRAAVYLDLHGVGELAPAADRGSGIVSATGPAVAYSRGHHMAAVINRFPGPLALGWAGDDPGWLELGGRGIRVHAPGLDAAARGESWRQFMRSFGCPALPAEAVLDAIAGRYVTPYEVIRAAARECADRIAAAGTRAAPDRAMLTSAICRRQTRSLGRWSVRVQTTDTWDELVLPDEAAESLRAILRRVRHAARVFDTWGFDRAWASERGLTALFHGPPGTGKTMAAGVIAQTLERELYRVDLSKITSHWVGETEKNLDELFDQATANEAILVFDEADSLFARRTQVVSSTDRYANLAVNFLLQRLEEFAGITILTSNKAEDIDEAFRRRVRFQVEFPQPDRPLRERLWRTLIPETCELAGPIDFADLAAQYEMSGAHIKNAILRAAFAAADCGRGVGAGDLRDAAEEEYRNMGKQIWTPLRRPADSP
ncbi:MAG: ATP-binding protein [Proteobacteria bacterium]|nr:ATP-binding protein [Pseudomonadota bacterium]